MFTFFISFEKEQMNNDGIIFQGTAKENGLISDVYTRINLFLVKIQVDTHFLVI